MLEVLRVWEKWVKFPAIPKTMLIYIKWSRDLFLNVKTKMI